MFTGIIEATGLVTDILKAGTNRTFWISSPISGQLKVDQSVSHNGVCLTVEAIKGGSHRVTAIEETLSKTNMEEWKKGEIVNLERCLVMGGRLDGHLVQGHVDTKGVCLKRIQKEGSWELEIEFPEEFAELVIEKGSVCINGISLTCFDVQLKTFRVAIIPFTWEHTNICKVMKGSSLNIEFDIMGKYLLRGLTLRSKL